METKGVGKIIVKIFTAGALAFLILHGTMVQSFAEDIPYAVLVEGENDGECEGEYWVEDVTSPYKWVKNPAWTEPTCDYERVQDALDTYPSQKILLSGTFDFNDRNVAIMYDNTELHGDGSAVIKNGSNTITVGHLRHDIQYHFEDPDQFDHYKIVRNFVINNIRFEESLMSAIQVIGHDGESYITNNEFIGGRFTEVNVGYHNHNANLFVGVWNLIYQDVAIKGVINVDNNNMDGQLRIDPEGHKFWYYDRPDLTCNGMVWGIANFFNGAIVNANNNTIKNVGTGILIWTAPFDDSGRVKITNNEISIVNGPYSYSAGIQVVTWTLLTKWEYLIADNDITVDYQPELDFATYPEWGSNPEADYAHSWQNEGISLDFYGQTEALVTGNTIGYTENHPEEFYDYYSDFSCITVWHYTSDTIITHNKFEGSALYAVNFTGGNTNNIMQANNFEHFTPYTEGFNHPSGFYLEPADIIFGSRFPADNNVVIGGGSSSGMLDIIDTGTGNLVGNNNVAHTDPHLLQTYMDAIKNPWDRIW